LFIFFQITHFQALLRLNDFTQPVRWVLKIAQVHDGPVQIFVNVLLDLDLLVHFQRNKASARVENTTGLIRKFDKCEVVLCHKI